jgi:hypothetical protein
MRQAYCASRERVWKKRRILSPIAVACGIMLRRVALKPVD